MKRAISPFSLRGFGFLAAAAICLASCADSPKAIVVSGSASGPRFVLELQPGAEYHKSQIAAWVETPEGGFIETIYVTAKAARGSWIMAPKEGRPEALPVWSHACAQNGRDEIDAVASATPSGTIVYGSSLAARLPAGNYVVWLEINRSFDYNEAYPKAAGVGGQPSIIYRAEIQVGPAASEAVFEPVGTGSPDGSNGNIHEGLAGITTARALFSSLRVRYEAK